MKSDLNKLNSFTLETSKNDVIRNFLRNGRVRVKYMDIFVKWLLGKKLEGGILCFVCQEVNAKKGSKIA